MRVTFYVALTIVDITAMANPVSVTYTLSSCILMCMGYTFKTIVVGWSITSDAKRMTFSYENGTILSRPARVTDTFAHMVP
jgi:hypothetical protein